MLSIFGKLRPVWLGFLFISHCLRPKSYVFNFDEKLLWTENHKFRWTTVFNFVRHTQLVLIISIYVSFFSSRLSQPIFLNPIL